jgi:hypothetical protein
MEEAGTGSMHGGGFASPAENGMEEGQNALLATGQSRDQTPTNPFVDRSAAD